MKQTKTQKISSIYGRIELQFVTKQRGAWNWARTRGYYRLIYSPYMKPGKISRIRPGEKVLWTSSQVTADYKGGRWGYGQAEKDAINELKNTSFAELNK